MTSYTDLVAEAKKRARDVLRAEKIAKWLSRKAALENTIKTATENLAKSAGYYEQESAVALFEANHLHEDHPARADRIAAAQKLADENTKYVDEMKERETKYLTDLDKELSEVNKAITEWTDGTRKVDLDRLNTLANEFVKEAVKDDFVATTPAVA